MYNSKCSTPTLLNCTFSSNSAKNGGGMFNNNDSIPTMLNCTFSSNSASSYGGGIYNMYSSVPDEPNCSNPILTNCIFSGNSASWGGGIYNMYSNPILTNCIFSGNSASWGGGFVDEWCSKSILINCTFIDNSAEIEGGGMWCYDCCFGDPVLTNCIFWDNKADGVVNESSQIYGNSTYCNPIINYSCIQGWTGILGGTGNIDTDPLFVDPANGDYHVAAGSPCIDAGDNSAVPPSLLTDLDGNPRIVNGTVDMGAYEFQGIIYVDEDAPNDPGPGDPEVSDPEENGRISHPFDTIQEAVDVAIDGSTIIVADGTYTGSGNRDIDFSHGLPEGQTRAITVCSENGPQNCIIDCQGSEGNFHRGFYFHNNEDENSILDGFTITNGFQDGGGICCYISSPVIRNNIIVGNQSRVDGDGGGGIRCSHGVSPTITNNIIMGNMCPPGAGGGGIICYDVDSPTITNNIISGNTAPTGGGVLISGSNATISNCTITGNSASMGDGVLLSQCNPKLANCTISGNNGVGIYNYFSNPAISNCIIWGNMGTEIYLSNSTPVITYSNIEGGWPGIGNIDADPLFVDPDANDFHLKSEGWRWYEELVHGSHWWCDYVTSPCIDAGNPGSPLGDELLTIPDDPSHDWGVNLRINMGAYGGTAEASMPPYDWALLGDLSNDGVVDYVDLAGQLEDWLTIANQLPGDLNRDGVVNAADFALLAQDWLAKTSWYEPPIVLEIYSSNYPKELLDIITMPQEGEITISIEREDYYYIYASRQGYSTELYYCEKGDTIDVDLDEIIHDKFNGVIFMSDVFFADQYLENTDVNVLDGNTPGSTIVAQFQTDSQGRFAIDPLAPGIYYFEFTFDSIHREEVEIQGQYQDFIFPYDAMVDKPNIYIYPEETMELDVNIVFPHGGHVTTSVPDYGTGWHITVEPSGIIDGQYDCLFYESLQPDYGQYEAGWVVAQDQLEGFFRNNMALTGFNQKEIDDFIEYWIPRLTEYPYYAIYPQYNDELEEMIKLEFSEQPTNLIRLIYSVRGLETGNLTLDEAVIPAFNRDGFTVAEWGVILKQ